jgi:amidophosphoribosyltransferase
MIIKMLREAGAAEIHMRIASPPTRHPCHYGIDMGKEGDYIATNDDGSSRSSGEISQLVGADSLHYLSPDGLARALKRPLNRRCTACFTGDYPIAPEEAGKNIFESQVGDDECTT